MGKLVLTPPIWKYSSGIGDAEENDERRDGETRI